MTSLAFAVWPAELEPVIDDSNMTPACAPRSLIGKQRIFRAIGGQKMGRFGVSVMCWDR